MMAAQLWLAEDSVTQKSEVKDDFSFLFLKTPGLIKTYFNRSYLWIHTCMTQTLFFWKKTVFTSFHLRSLQEFKATFHQVPFRVIHHSALVRTLGTRTVSDVWLLRCPLTPDCLRGHGDRVSRSHGSGWGGDRDGWAWAASDGWKGSPSGSEEPRQSQTSVEGDQVSRVNPDLFKWWSWRGGTGESDV